MKRLKKGCSILVSDVKGVWVGVLAFLAYSFLANTFLERYCPLVLLSGLPCPACGMTRASILFIQGRFVESLIMHPMVLSVLIYFFVFCLFRYILFINTECLINLLIFILVAGIFIYILRMFFVFPNRVPMVYYPRNMISRLLSFVNIFR